MHLIKTSAETKRKTGSVNRTPMAKIHVTTVTWHAPVGS